MDIYVFDGDEERRRRPWRQLLLSTTKDSYWDETQRCFKDKATDLGIKSCFLVAHQTYLDEPEKQIKYIKESRITCLVVSGGSPFEFEEILNDAGGYKRKTSVAVANSPNYVFQKCFKSFWEDFQMSRIPNWYLVEPGPWPEFLRSQILTQFVFLH